MCVCVFICLSGDGLCVTVCVRVCAHMYSHVCVSVCLCVCVFMHALLFQVFELNSSTRRSGSQVISILQEATQSHQITTQLKATKQPTSSQDDDENESNDTQDIKPSRTITSFFKPIGGGKTNKDGGVVQSNSCKGAVEDDHFKLALASHTVILIEEVCLIKQTYMRATIHTFMHARTHTHKHTHV